MICATPLLHAPANVEDGYAKFLAWAAASFADQTGNSANGLYPSAIAQAYGRWIYPAVKSATMWGSPIGGPPSYGLYTHDSFLSRIIQHLFQDATAAAANEGKVVVFHPGSVYGESDTIGQDRNGYYSSNYSAFTCYYGAEMYYFDPRYPTKRIRAIGYSGSWLQENL